MDWKQVSDEITKLDPSIKQDSGSQSNDIHTLVSTEYILLKVDNVSGYYLRDAKKDGIENAVYYSYNPNNELIKFNSLTEAIHMIKKWICNDLKRVGCQTKEGVNL